MRFSLVIPVAPDRDAPIVDFLKKMDYPKSKFEIIVIKGLNPSENRNLGSQKAKGEIIGFLDDDAEVEPDFLKNVESFFNKYKSVDIAGGPQLTPRSQRGFAKISGYALTSKFGAAGTAVRYKVGKLSLDADESSLTSANLFVKKEIMKRIKFDPKLFPGEDPKFIEDAKSANLRIAYCPDFVIYHKRRETLQALIKQISNYGKVRPLKEPFIKTLNKPLFLIPLLFTVYLILALIFITTKFYIFAIFPLVIYILLDLFFSLIESLKNKDFKAIFVLPFIYPIIHVSYGTGMIYGYFLRRKLKT